MVFYKSKIKTKSLLVCLLLMLIGIPLLLRIMNIIHIISPFGAADIVFLPFAFNSVLKQGSQRLEISEKLNFFDGDKFTSIDISNIKSLKYKGLFFVPMSEMMIIESDNMDVIKVDFNFIQYKVVWRHVLEACKQNKNIEIDERLLRYAKRNTEVP